MHFGRVGSGLNLVNHEGFVPCVTLAEVVNTHFYTHFITWCTSVPFFSIRGVITARLEFFKKSTLTLALRGKKVHSGENVFRLTVTLVALYWHLQPHAPQLRLLNPQHAKKAMKYLKDLAALKHLKLDNNK